MIYPNVLKAGDKIRIVSPAGKVNAKFVHEAVEKLDSLGFVVEISKHALGGFHKYSGTDAQRLQDLQDAMDDNTVSAILCSRGGYGSMRILDELDWSGMRSQPKALIGFSDITAIHAAAWLEGVVSVHGPMCKDIVHGAKKASEDLLSILKGDSVPIGTGSHPFNRIGSAIGELLGGNLSMLYALQGTPYEIDWEGKILFIEDLAENLYHLDRIMQNFRLSGKLNKLAGLVIGQFTDMGDEEFGKTAYEIISEAVEGFDYPVVFDFPIGHVEDNRPVMHGADYQLDVGVGDVKLKPVV